MTGPIVQSRFDVKVNRPELQYRLPIELAISERHEQLGVDKRVRYAVNLDVTKPSMTGDGHYLKQAF